MKSFIKKLFCHHKWNTDCVNLRTDEFNPEKSEIITIAYKWCKKCAASKLIFIYGNK